MAKRKLWFATVKGHRVAKSYDEANRHKIEYYVADSRYEMLEVLYTVSKYAGREGLSTARVSNIHSVSPSNYRIKTILADLERRGLIEKGSPDYEPRLSYRQHQYKKITSDIANLRTLAKERGAELGLLFRGSARNTWLAGELRIKGEFGTDPELVRRRIEDLTDERRRLSSDIYYLRKQIAEIEKEGG